MLSGYNKEELIGWVLQRLDWLKVVLVANRSDNKDKLLLEHAKKQVGSSETCTVKPYHINSITEYTSIKQDIIADYPYHLLKASPKRLVLMKKAWPLWLLGIAQLGHYSLMKPCP